MNYDRLTTAEYPRGRKPTPLRAKVAEVVVWTLYWGLFFYTVYRWAES